ncbi:BTB/POZ domain-containing protein At5g41330-like [Cryptomeria japonica]|uniref:BTB/POZ domain-containing protein At5g41330-like n=1 Tax=Cryptomeria japonica TaxID=3369 RepID=UPI0027DA98F7|nr:BTB/POZ domain-containing protein At5g41330-like [Cryptomeria japonica]
MAELGRQIGFGGSKSSPATKLEWIGSHNLLMSSSASVGPFGYRSNVKLWDIRSQKIVWECRESNPGPVVHQAKSDSLSDCFADVTVNEKFGSIFKLGARNGGLFMVDLRQLNNSNPWVALGDTIPGVRGAQNRILGYGKRVFVSRGGDIEAWCEVDLREKSKILRKNIVDSKQGSERITRMTAGGNTLFVARKGLQGVEVWDSLRSKAASNSLV